MDTGTTPLFAGYPAGFPAALVAGRTVSLNLFVPAGEEYGQKVEPLHRHRAKVITGKRPFAQFYADPRSAKWEEYVATTVVEQLSQTPTQAPYGTEDFVLPLKESRVLLTLRFNLPKPKSYPARIVHHTKKPDARYQSRPARSSGRRCAPSAGYSALPA